MDDVVWPKIRLDSSLAGGRWTFDGGRAAAWLNCDSRSGRARLVRGGRVVREWADPLAGLRWMAAFEGMEGGRWVGYLSYDLGRWFERLPVVAGDELGLPLYSFGWYGGERDPVGSAVRNNWGVGAKDVPHSGTYGKPSFVRSNFSREAYEAAVGRCIEYVREGDVFQVNLSQRFSAAVPASAAEIYARLMGRAPAWYGALLEFPDHALICNSPEMFLTVAPGADGRRTVATRPIKGTRPRRAGMDVELRDSVKDQAELNMIVDLERNDLGRVCEIGSVRVTLPRAIEAHPTVYHGAATVEGVLRADVGFVELLAATFPGGSVTGAPKIRAMEIIEGLEPTRRGPYCGAIGYLAGDGSMAFNVAIRTMIVAGGRVHVSVGGGIVADSQPAAEYEETLVKARAMFEALGVSADDLRE